MLLTKDSKLINEIDKIIESKPRKVMVNVKIFALLNKELKLSVSDGINEVMVIGDITSKAKNNPTSKDDIISKINKLGDTIYQIDKLDIQMDESIFIPFKKFNDLRRELFDQLNKKRLYKIDYIKRDYFINIIDYKKEKLRSILVNKKTNNLDYDIIYSENKDDDCIIKLSKVMEDYNNLDLNKEYLVGELGAFNKLKNIYTDYSFNVVNSYSVAILHSLGAKRITLSLELTSKQIENIIKAYQNRYHKNPNLEVIVNAYREVMTLKTNLNKVYNNKDLFLVDKFNNKYKIREVNDLSYIYEPKRHLDQEDYYELGINVIRTNNEI